MCGIIGISSQKNLVDLNWLTEGRDTMRHRGPDDAGLWCSQDRHVGLGHRRLAIVDLSPAGHQPMLDTSGELCIVFNGEVYNFQDLRRDLAAKGYVFRSQSDTEVMLSAYREWGIDCLSRLNGMFVFALYDASQRRLFMARDRAGEKPLYYSQTDGVLRFASELKALMTNPAMPRRIDPEALDCYLAMGFIPGDRCILKGVKKLPPAHALTFDLNSSRLRIWRYWELPPPPEDERVDEGKIHEELEALLADSVKRQLVADVPVGILLSGGVDSSLITAMAVRAKPSVKTFTVCFPGFGKYDETDHARLIARHFCTEHLELDTYEVTVDLLPLLARQFDEPMVDSSMIPTYLICSLVRQYCTVALGGDGGDELFGGYKHYKRLLAIQKWFGKIPSGMRYLVSNMSERHLPVGFRGRNWLQALKHDLHHDLPPVAFMFDSITRRRLMGSDWPLIAENIYRQRISSADDLTQRATRTDFENYLAEDILVKVDRASMLSSLEVRAPFLDYRIIEFAFANIPSRLKVTTESQKLLTKKIAHRLLPKEFELSRKQGFSIPINTWMRKGRWKEMLQDAICGSLNSFFNRKEIAVLLYGQLMGCSNGERLFALLLFELWRREYKVSM